MVFTFIFAFLNSAVLPFVVNMDFRYTSILSAVPVKGQYADMNREWYQKVAPVIVSTMMILTFMPVIGWVTEFYLIRPFTICFKDSRSYLAKFKKTEDLSYQIKIQVASDKDSKNFKARDTNLNNKIKYIELYLGPNY